LPKTAGDNGHERRDATDDDQGRVEVAPAVATSESGLGSFRRSGGRGCVVVAVGWERVSTAGDAKACAIASPSSGQAGAVDPVSIRSVDVADLPDVRDVFRRSSLSNAEDRPHLLAHPEVLELDVDVAGGRTRVAVVAGRVVGFATTSVGPDGVELDDLFVAPEWMRRGVATALVTDAVADARRLGVGRIEVTANEHARAFYESVGFVEIGQAETQFGPALRMQLDLAGRTVARDDIGESS
jgi:ribosomal protein S18 acetylase RimI-like enzyme